MFSFRKFSLSAVLSLLSLLCAFSVSIFAQEVTGNILGTVKDPTGSAVSAATVIVTNVDRGWSNRASSDASGAYQINLLPIGRYTVVVEAAGFKKLTMSGIVLNANDHIRVDPILEVGDVFQQVTVSAEATAVQTQEGAVGETMVSRQVTDTPLNGRQMTRLVPLLPGTYSFIPQSPTDTMATKNSQIAVNGVRPSHTVWFIDGGWNVDNGGNWNINNMPSIENIAEFRVQRGNYSAESGGSGAGQVNVITKSGNRDFHGSAYEFFRNDKLDATDFFQNRAGRTKPPLRYNNFGVTLGGPVIIPKLYNQDRNKTFFFVSAEAGRIRVGAPQISTVPTDAFRAGDFSALLDPDNPFTRQVTVIRDPITGLAYPNNIVPKSSILPAATSLLSLFPAQTNPGASANFAFASRSEQDQRFLSYRVDHRFNDNHQVFLRLSDDSVNFIVPASLPAFRSGSEFPGRNVVANLTSTLTPTVQNQFSFTYTWNRYVTGRFIDPLDPAAFSATFTELYPNTPDNYPYADLQLTAIPARIPGISINGFNSLSPPTPWANTAHQYDFKENFQKIWSAHVLSLGFLYQRERKFEPADTNVFGQYGFDGTYTGYAFADYLLGYARTYSESSGVTYNDNQRRSFEWYVNDRWRLTPRLSISIGVRWSHFGIPWEPTSRYRVFWPEDFNRSNAVAVDPISGTIVTGSGDVYNGVTNPQNRFHTFQGNWAPRFSFAYDLLGNAKTAIRGGYGLFYSREILGNYILIASNPPLVQRAELTGVRLGDPNGGQASGTRAPIALSTIDQKQLVPYTAQWNLGIQHELARNTVLDVSYIGTNGNHFMMGRDINQGPVNADAAAGKIAVNALRPHPGYAAINNRQQTYISRYHSLQASLTRNFYGGLATQVSYTWAHSIDNADYSGGVYGAFPNSYDMRPERASSSFDIRHNLTVSYVWELPFFKSVKNPFVKGVITGWKFSGITQFATGAPTNVVIGSDRAGNAASGQRPWVLGPLNVDNSMPERMLNTNNVVLPALGVLTTTGRNLYRLPGVNNWDMTLSKQLRFNEQRYFELRVESFNIFNHTQFSAVSTSMASSTFGQATATRLPRNIQLGLKFVF
jgi:hypothetical protein